MNTIQAKNLQFVMDENSGLALFSSLDQAVQTFKTPLWFMQIEKEGEEITLDSKDQQTQITAISDHSMEICYDQLVDNLGFSYAIQLKVCVAGEGDTLLFSAEMENKMEDGVILQFTCPVFQAKSLYGAKEEDVLYLPAELGMRVENPWVVKRRTLSVLNPYFWKITRGHRLYHLTYPGCCMAWMGVESQDHFLYMAQHDAEAANCELFAGPMGPGNGQGIVMQLAHNPVVKAGKKGTMPVCCIALLSGDWRSGAILYQDYAKKNLLGHQQTVDWMKVVKGLYHVTMKNGYQRFWDYQDLPGIFEKAKALGMDGLVLHGWWDRAIRPEDPCAFLSAESKEQLKEAIGKIQNQGGRVILACHDLFPEKYGPLAAENVVCKDKVDREFLPEYRYQPMGSHQAGHKAMITGCPGAKAWQDALQAVAAHLQDCGADSILYQSLGTPMGLLCTNPEHDHGLQTEKWHAQTLKLFKGLNNTVPAGAAMPYDAASDYAGYLLYEDYISPANTGSFPQLFLHTFPEIPMLVHLEGREEQDIQRDLLFAFVMGLRLDLHLTGRYQNYLPLAGDLLCLREKFANTLVKGRFDISEVLAVPETVYWAEYACCCGKRTRVLWNAGGQAQEVMGECLQPNDLLFMERRADMPWEKALQVGVKEGRIQA